MSTVLVTGGSGFIGKHLVNSLVNSKHKVIVIDNKITLNNSKAIYYEKNINNLEDIDHLFNDVEYVFHLAAESRIQPSILNPSLAYTTNVIGTLNVLECCRKYNIKRIMYSSTSSVYGLTKNFPTREDSSIDCLNPYAHSKFLGEELVKRYTKIHNVDSVIFRYFNVFGEGSPVEGPYAPVIGIFLDQLKNGKPLTIVGDGKRKRDFIYVGDVVSINIAAMNIDGSSNGSVYNVGSGTNISIQEIADLISLNQTYLPDRLGEADNTLADNRAAKEWFLWSPKVDIRDWIKQYAN